jgi:uncharacterized protein with beta-barrel porin domain
MPLSRGLPGGTLGGNGIVGNTTNNGGVLSPGNSIGLLTVQGNLVFTAAASYLVEVSRSNADAPMSRARRRSVAHTTSFFLVSGFASGAYSAKLLAGTKHFQRLKRP